MSSSSDETASDFEALFSSMPWLAVPFEAPETKAKATKKFNITNQVPALVVVDHQGNILTENRYWPIISPSEFPWKHASTTTNEGPKKRLCHEFQQEKILRKIEKVGIIATYCDYCGVH